MEAIDVGVMVDKQRWQRIEQVFADALNQPAGLRETFLNDACADDTPLRHELEELLRAHDTVGVLDGGIASQSASPLIASLPLGTQVGHWLIEKLIGRGGMGEVYSVRRAAAAFDQHAALKLLRYEAAGQLDRFHAERQILARLEHPGIARLLDGGTTADGRPYTVMEYVEGRSLTDYCNEHHLPLRERLALFGQVCDAVTFAHRNLVVHRDLKPDNILVDSTGAVKLLDFGIAKLLDVAAWPSDDDHTIAPFTPDYAAPEQLSGQAVTTATNIYALGVLLFELLTGERPLRTRGLPSNLAPIGVTPNDSGDGDDGPNEPLNKPFIQAVVMDASTNVATNTGSLSAAPNSIYEIHFYTNAACDPSGHGGGEVSFSFSPNPSIVTVTTDAPEDATFSRRTSFMTVNRLLTALTRHLATGPDHPHSRLGIFQLSADRFQSRLGLRQRFLVTMSSQPSRHDAYIRSAHSRSRAAALGTCLRA